MRIEMLGRKAFLILFLLPLQAAEISSQEEPVIIRPTPRSEIVLAIPEIALQNPERASELADVLRTINQVLWDDLKFAGYFALAAKSFYSSQTSTGQRHPDYEAWNALPLRIDYLSSGTVDLVGGVVNIDFRLYDLKGRLYGFGLKVSGDKSSARVLAHRWADELVYRLTAGESRGIASTKIAFVSQRGAAKEVYIMDYDGYKPSAFTSSQSLNKFPTWSPDNSKIAFISDRQRPWEIYVYSFIDGTKLPFPNFNSTASTPSFSPDGTHFAFALSTARGDTDIFVSKLDGSDRTNVTNNPAVDTSPTWAPSGRQIAFASKREDSLQLYICDADGTNVRRLLKDGGEADSPSWSPEGKWVAFHWKPRRTGQFDIYLAEVSSGKIYQLTSSSGNNTNPSWAPDGRHLAFESDRTGSNQIYIMRLGAQTSDIRMITNRGNNSNPAWGSYVGTTR
jgi:TolB protein